MNASPAPGPGDSARNIVDTPAGQGAKREHENPAGESSEPQCLTITWIPSRRRASESRESPVTEGVQGTGEIWELAAKEFWFGRYWTEPGGCESSATVKLWNPVELSSTGASCG